MQYTKETRSKVLDMLEAGNSVQYVHDNTRVSVPTI